MENIFNTILSIVGHAAILGNPFGLLSKIGSGVVALVEKPTEGLIQGPFEMGVGVIQGTGTFVKNVLEGTLGSFEKITGSVSSGLATMALVI